MKKIFLLGLVASLALFSCSEDDSKFPVAGPNSTIVGFPNKAVTENFKTNLATANLNVAVHLISYANETFPSADITSTWSVDASSTAIAGVDYDTVGTNNSVTIGAGKNVGFIPFTVYPIVYDAFNPKKLVLNLNTTSATGIIGSQYKQVTVTLQGVCVSDIGGAYTASTLRINNGVTYTFGSEFFTPTTGTSYKTNYVGPYYSPGQVPGGSTSVNLGAGTSAGYVFTDVCGKIRLQTQQLASIFSNEVRQSDTQYNNSSLNTATGVVTVHYSIFFSGNTVERAFISTYTPL